MAFQYVSTLTVRSLGSHDHLQNLTSSKRLSEDQFQKLNLIYSTIIFDNGIFKNNHCNFLIRSYTVISLLGLNQKGVDTSNKRGRTMYLPFQGGRKGVCKIIQHVSGHIELPAKLLDYFLRSNKSNINQSSTC
jgi:hypothetical protein